MDGVTHVQRRLLMCGPLIIPCRRTLLRNCCIFLWQGKEIVPLLLHRCASLPRYQTISASKIYVSEYIGLDAFLAPQPAYLLHH